MASAYVHGYGSRETQRLQDQAATLADLLHADTHYPAGAQVLEAGCGVGAQTVTLAAQNPLAQFTAIDLTAASLAEAGKAVAAAGHRNVSLQQADIFALPFALCGAMLTLTTPPDPAASAAFVMRLVKTCRSSAGKAATEMANGRSVDTVTPRSVKRRSINRRISWSISRRSTATGALDSR